jgi:hypothetical protein
LVKPLRKFARFALIQRHILRLKPRIIKGINPVGTHGLPTDLLADCEGELRSNWKKLLR